MAERLPKASIADPFRWKGYVGDAFRGSDQGLALITAFGAKWTTA
jgi:hypothetical protein